MQMKIYSEIFCLVSVGSGSKGVNRKWIFDRQEGIDREEISEGRKINFLHAPASFPSSLSPALSFSLTRLLPDQPQYAR